MRKLYRSLLWTGFVALAVAACGDDVTITPPPPPPPPADPGIRSVTVGPDGAHIAILGTVQMSAAVTTDPGAATPSIAWSTSSGATATVNGSGLVTGVSAGSAAIKATATSGTSTGEAVATVIVDPPAACVVSSVTATPGGATLVKDQTIQASASVNFTGPCTGAVTWAALSPAIASVSGTGVITANAAGNAVITVTSNDPGSKSAAIAITVVTPDPATLSIQAITTGTLATPVVLTAVMGQIEISLNVDRGDKILDRVEALIGGVVVASQTFTIQPSPAALGPATVAPVTVVLSTNTAQVRKSVSNLYWPVVFNGQTAITANLYVSGNPTPIASNAVPVVMANPDAVIAGPLAFAPASTSPSSGSWFKGAVNWSSVNYVAFSDVNPAAFTITSAGVCGVSGAATIAGTPRTTGISINSAWSCSATEGSVSYASFTATPGVTASPEIVAVAPTTWSTVTSAFTLGGESRYNLFAAAAPAPAAVLIDNLGPTLVSNEIGFLAGCSPSIPSPGCWINGSYSFAGDFVATDGGSGAPNTLVANTVTVYDLAATGPTVCGVTVTTPATLAEDPSPIKYTVCAEAADPLGNLSGDVAGFNAFGVDKTVPTIAYAGTYTPDSTVPDPGVVPAQVIDYSVQDNNSGLSATASMSITSSNTLAGACGVPSGTLTGAGTAPLTLLSGGFAPDNGCGVVGYYRWTGEVTDRAGNASGTPVKKAFALDIASPAVTAVNFMPFYGGGLAADFTAFGSDDVDILAAMLELGYVADSGGVSTPITLRYNPTIGTFGTAWDNTLYTATPASGVLVSVPAGLVLGRVVIDSTDANASTTVASLTGYRLDLFDLRGDSASTATVAIPGPFVDATKVTTANAWTVPNIATPVFAVIGGQCTFTYGTPTNGPTIPEKFWVLSQLGGSPGTTFQFVQEITSVPALISDNGIQRAYRYSLGTAACPAFAKAMFVKGTATIPTGYLVGGI